MAPFVELMIALALCMLMFGAWGILVFMGGCGAYVDGSSAADEHLVPKCD